MKKAYIVLNFNKKDFTQGAVDTTAIAAANGMIPLIMPLGDHPWGFSEEESIRARIELIRMSDCVILSDEEDELRKNIINRIELEAAKELGKVILLSKSTMRRWFAQQEENGGDTKTEELAQSLIKKCAGLRYKAKNRWDELFGGKNV